MSAIRDGIDSISRPVRHFSSEKSKRKPGFGGVFDLVLVVLVAFAMGTRTPVGGLAWYGMERMRGHESDLPSLTAYFNSGASAPVNVDQLPLLPPLIDEDEWVLGNGLPEPWRTAARSVAADKRLAKVIAARLQSRPDLRGKDRVLALLDEAFLETGDPEAALETLAIGTKLRDRAISRSRAAGDTGPEKYVVHRRYLPSSAIRDADQIVNGAMGLATALDLQWPIAIDHRVTSNWGQRIHPVMKKKMFHNGVDLAVPIGTPLYSAQAGEVVVIGSDDRSGKYVVIEHGHGVRTAYCHLSEIPVKKRKKLKKGEFFAKSGNTGRSTGPHLHFIVRISGATVDPLRFSRAAKHSCPGYPAAVSNPRPIPWLRLGLILGVGTYVQIGPVMTQGFGMDMHPYFKTWRMYRTFGRDICRVRFLEHLDTGDIVERDRFEVLGTDFESASRFVSFIPSETQVARTGKTMCRSLGRDAELRVTGECGSLYEWRPLARLADQNLCEMSEADLRLLDQRTKKKRKKKRKQKAAKAQKPAEDLQ
jgi:murein DD-endopeptidase MepM/ murein hydrolase activator NlpD